LNSKGAGTGSGLAAASGFGFFSGRLLTLAVKSAVCFVGRTSSGLFCKLPRAAFSKMLREGFPAGCAVAIGGVAPVFPVAESAVPGVAGGGVGGVGFAAVFEAAVASRVSVVAVL